MCVTVWASGSQTSCVDEIKSQLETAPEQKHVFWVVTLHDHAPPASVSNKGGRPFLLCCCVFVLGAPLADQLGAPQLMPALDSSSSGTGSSGVLLGLEDTDAALQRQEDLQVGGTEPVGLSPWEWGQGFWGGGTGGGRTEPVALGRVCFVGGGGRET